MSESPIWKKPSEVMKIHRRRKSVSQRRITTDADKRTNVIYKSPSKPKKRTNPFGRSSDQPTKRQNVDDSNQENRESKNGPDSQLFDILDSVEQNAGGREVRQAEATSKLLDNQFAELSQTSPTQTALQEKKQNKQTTDYQHLHTEEKKPSQFLPVDWSLKLKLRIVSSRPLNWCAQLRSSEEASGITQFVQSQSLQMDSLTDQKQAFQQSCMFWIHPNLPWARLFPRIIDDSKQSISFTPVMNDLVQKSLQTDWEQSFTSVYYQLRTGLCPYFYLCTHQFTVLFHHQKGNQLGPVAMVTPTTRGFRELLENEGIEFKMPVGGQQSSPGRMSQSGSSPGTQQQTAEKSGTGGEEEDGDDLLESDDAASGWLESMGLNKKEFPTLDPRKVKLQREGFRVIDHRPESLVLVAGGDIHALFNFLLNCRSCTAMSGVQAGIPPTILSPKSFRGATLKAHKVKHTAVKQSDREGNISHAHILEVSGPILPSHCQDLVSLLHHTQSADFGAVYNTHEPTVPFNILPTVLNKDKCNTCGSQSSNDKTSSHRNSSHSNSNHSNSPNNSSHSNSSHRNSSHSNNNLSNSPNNSSHSIKTSHSNSSHSNRSPGNSRNNSSHRAVDVQSPEKVTASGDHKVKGSDYVCKCDNVESEYTGNKYFRHVPISELGRLGVIKEYICTKDGFTVTD